MRPVTLEEAQSRLAELIESLPAGEEIAVTRGDRRVATITVSETGRPPRRFGTLEGSVLSISPDFDAIPEAFN